MRWKFNWFQETFLLNKYSMSRSLQYDMVAWSILDVFQGSCCKYFGLLKHSLKSRRKTLAILQSFIKEFPWILFFLREGWTLTGLCLGYSFSYCGCIMNSQQQNPQICLHRDPCKLRKHSRHWLSCEIFLVNSLLGQNKSSSTSYLCSYNFFLCVLEWFHFWSPYWDPPVWSFLIRFYAEISPLPLDLKSDFTLVLTLTRIFCFLPSFLSLSFALQSQN